MNRRETMAIIGAYSRQGFNATPAAGGIWIDSENVHEYRTAREARRDTGIDVQRIYAERRQHAHA
jgi:hypothetical protein